MAAACGGVILATAWATIWAAFGFRYAGMNPTTLPPGGYAMTGTLEGTLEGVRGAKRAVITAAARLWLLPEAFLDGMVHVFALLGRLAFLRGEYSVTGWWYYFPYTFLVKTPLPTLIAATVAVGRLVATGGAMNVAANQPAVAVEQARPVPGWYPFVPLAAVWLVVWGAAITTLLNISHRHILPVYPVLFILIGSLSASVLEGVYRARPWTAALEEEYRGLVAEYRRLRASQPDGSTGAAAAAAPVPAAVIRRLGQLQDLRLLGHLRDREPEADIGGSFLIFAVTAADLDRYLAGASPRQFDVTAIPPEAFD